MMPKFIVFLCFISFNIFAQNTIKVKAKVEKATVFINQVLLEQSFSLTLPAGASKIIIEDIASTIDVNSIKVGGKGDVTLLGIKHGVNYLNTKTAALQDSVKAIAKDIEQLNVMLEVGIQEEKMIMANADVKSNQDGLTPDELKEMILLFRDKLTDVGNRRLGLRRQIAELNIKTQKLQNQINSQGNNSIPLGEIILNVNAARSNTVTFDLAYVANNAGWMPSYDIRVRDLKSNVNINYKADVYQNTGIDWSNVKLVLSTSNPSAGGVMGDLYPQFLSLYIPVAPAPVYSRVMKNKDEENALGDVVVTGYSIAANNTKIIETTMSVSFDIKDAYTINSGGQPETVEIQVYNVDADYKTIIKPKIDNNAFLVAELKDWAKLNLLSGEANVYFENQYIGKSRVEESSVKEIMQLSLGRDTRVIAKREEIENMKARKTFGNNIKETFAYKIELRNLKSEHVNLVIEDQVPVSQDSDIDVDIEEISGAELIKETGKLTWKAEIMGAQVQEKILRYTVKYPKDKTVNNL